MELILPIMLLSPAADVRRGCEDLSVCITLAGVAQRLPIPTWALSLKFLSRSTKWVMRQKARPDSSRTTFFVFEQRFMFESWPSTHITKLHYHSTNAYISEFVSIDKTTTSKTILDELAMPTRNKKAFSWAINWHGIYGRETRYCQPVSFWRRSNWSRCPF